VDAAFTTKAAFLVASERTRWIKFVRDWVNVFIAGSPGRPKKFPRRHGLQAIRNRFLP
jgi:hypothetical protein